MTLRRLIGLVAVSALAISPVFGGGLTVGIMTGLNPDVLHFNSSVTKSEIQLGNYVQTDLASNSGNSSIGATSSSIVGIPIGLNLRYLEKWYLVRLGFLYHISIGGTNSITTGKNSTVKQVEESYSIRMAEIPITFAFNIRNDEYTRFYAGAGPSIFFGSVNMIFDNGQADKLRDEDLYSGWALGMHLVVGGEVSLSSKFSLSMEIVFNYGNKSPVEDQSFTLEKSSSGTAQDAEEKEAPDILGVYSIRDDQKFVIYNPEHPPGLDFTGVQIVISLNYFIGVL